MKRLIYIIFTLLLCAGVNAQSDNQEVRYRRSSLYSMMLEHTNEKFYEEIRDAFMKLDVPDKFNDHDLSVKYVTMNKKNGIDTDDRISNYLKKNQVAKRMVSKWFNRDKSNGSFDVELIKDRGLYGANALEIQKAMQTIRGKSMLEDAGEELIGNSFVLVNNITYIDKERNAEIAAAVFSTLANIAGAIFGAGGIGDMIKSVAQIGQAISKTIAGFTVKTTTYLYQVEWNEEIANTFYNQYYYDANHIDMAKKAAFEADTTLFKLKYVGKYTANSQKTVMRGLFAPEEVFKKVLTRAIDKNIVELQKEFDVFKVKIPITSISPVIKAPVGLKEGVSKNSKFEVLEVVFNENTGKTNYKRVGVIKPVKIWDNRYMATEEGAEGADLGASTFEKVSGTEDFREGMLIREIKFSGADSQD